MNILIIVIVITLIFVNYAGIKLLLGGLLLGRGIYSKIKLNDIIIPEDITISNVEVESLYCDKDNVEVESLYCDKDNVDNVEHLSSDSDTHNIPLYNIQQDKKYEIEIVSETSTENKSI